MKGLRTASPRTVIRPPARKGSDAMPSRLAPRWSSLRTQKEKNSERVLGIKIEKETNMMGQRTASPRAVIPPPARKGSDAIPPRLVPPWSSLQAQKKKKEERALGIKIEKETPPAARGSSIMVTIRSCRRAERE